MRIYVAVPDFRIVVIIYFLNVFHCNLILCLNAVSSILFNKILLFVVAPTWTVEPKDISVLVNNAVFLHCKASGFPPPRVSWMKGTGLYSRFY